MQTQTSNTLHNAIMEAGSNDRPPMLAPEWQRFVTLFKQSQELKTVSYHELYDIIKQHQHEVNEIRAEKIARVANPLTLVAQQQPVYHPQNHSQNHPTHYTQNSSTRSQQAATRNRGKAIVNSPQPIYDQETSMVAEDEETSKDNEIDKLMALISLSFKKIYKPTNNNLRTSSNTSRANQDNSPRINRSAGYENQRIGNVAGARENVGSTLVQKSGIQCYICKEFGHVARECQKPKRAKDAAYHREKMLLYFIVYQMDVNSAYLYGKIEDEVYVCQPPGFEDPDFPDKVYKVKKALYSLHQAPRACQDKYVAEILKKFGFSDVKKESTPMETSKPLLKDEDGEEVDVHIETTSLEGSKGWTEVSLTETNIKECVPTPSNDLLHSGEDRMQLKELMDLCTNLSNKVLDIENEVIEMKSSHKAKIKVLESRVEKLEEENRSLTKELKSFNTRVESLAINETVMDKEESSKQGRKIADIDADAEVNLENVIKDDVKEVAKEVVEVMEIAKIIVNEVNTANGELNAANEEPVSASPTNITIAQPSEATKTTVDITSALKTKGIVFYDKEEQSDDVRKYQALKRKPVSVAQARKNVMIYLKNMAGYKMDYFKGMSYEHIRAIFEMEYNKDNANKQNLEEQEEVEELKKNLEKVPNDEDDVFMNVTPLSSKPPTTVDYKIYKEGKKKHFQIFRANGNHQMYLAFSTMLKNFDREDLEGHSVVHEDEEAVFYQTIYHHVKNEGSLAIPPYFVTANDLFIFEHAKIVYGKKSYKLELHQEFYNDDPSRVNDMKLIGNWRRISCCFMFGKNKTIRIKIPRKSLDEGLEYVEKNTMEVIMGTVKGVVIEEVVEDDEVKEASETRNSGKQLLLVTKNDVQTKTEPSTLP
nr:ribonuclease H-like domain, reverse transcriptase, RNA-dependent DNA polymerase [Tanacetum cinerariifolium]